MEFISAKLLNATQGACTGCHRDQAVLDAVVMQIDDHPTSKNAMRQPIKVGVKAHLICGECSRNHPLWKLKEDTTMPEPEPEPEPATVS